MPDKFTEPGIGTDRGTDETKQLTEVQCSAQIQQLPDTDYSFPITVTADSSVSESESESDDDEAVNKQLYQEYFSSIFKCLEWTSELPKDFDAIPQLM